MRNRVLKLFSILLTAIMIFTILPIVSLNGKLGGDVNAATNVTFTIRTYGDPNTENFGYIVEPNVDYKVPVVLFFHGIGGIKKAPETETWPERLAKDMSTWIAQGELEPCVFIVPRVICGKGKVNYEIEYKDYVNTYLQGILDEVKAGTFSSKADPNKPMTVCGISMGGVCSLYVGHKFRNDFINVGALSAGRQFCWLYQEPDIYTGMIFTPSNIQYSGDSRAHRLLSCSKVEQEGAMYQANQDYYALFGQKWGFAQYYQESGEHVRDTFMNEFYYFMYYVQHDEFPPVKGTASISGSPVCGQTLTASIADSNADTFSYQWTRDGNNISGATGTTYTLGASDVGHDIACEISGTYFSSVVTAATSGKISKKDGPDAPSVSAVSPSTVNGSDGKITGVDTTMEYDTTLDFANPKKVTSNEITGLCSGDYYIRVAETDTTKAGAVKKVWLAPAKDTSTDDQPVENVPEVTETDLSFEDLVIRLYEVALGREPEADGKKYWCDEVSSGRKTGADCALGFLVSEEFLGKGYSNDEFVEILYKTYFGRASEAEGKAFWVKALNDGTMDKITVIRCFADSTEWCDICASYGVRSGAPTAKASKASSNATKFATRLYTECLGRAPEEDGLKYWSLTLTNLETSGTVAAKGFFNSAEFIGKNTTNEAYVKCLYRTFMGRDAETDGLAYWVGELDKGADRNFILDSFANCQEFADICAEYGMQK